MNMRGRLGSKWRDTGEDNGTMDLSACSACKPDPWRGLDICRIWSFRLCANVGYGRRRAAATGQSAGVPRAKRAAAIGVPVDDALRHLWTRMGRRQIITPPGRQLIYVTCSALEDDTYHSNSIFTIYLIAGGRGIVGLALGNRA